MEREKKPFLMACLEFLCTWSFARNNHFQKAKPEWRWLVPGSLFNENISKSLDMIFVKKIQDAPSYCKVSSLEQGALNYFVLIWFPRWSTSWTGFSGNTLDCMSATYWTTQRYSLRLSRISIRYTQLRWYFSPSKRIISREEIGEVLYLKLENRYVTKYSVFKHSRLHSVRRLLTDSQLSRWVHFNCGIVSQWVRKVDHMRKSMETNWILSSLSLGVLL